MFEDPPNDLRVGEDRRQDEEAAEPHAHGRSDPA